MSYSGGYYSIRKPLVKAGHHKHTSTLEDPVSDAVLSAVNIIQAVPWKINNFVLTVMEEIWESGAAIGCVPSAEDEPVPPRLPDEQWEAMSDKEKMQYKAKVAIVHGKNAEMQGKREAFIRKLRLAQELRDQPAIYFPHNLDFRGRIYPMTQDLNPQNDDVAKGLLTFSRGKPLGTRGAKWLAIALANAAGNDKMSMTDREIWTRMHSDQIVRCATHPLETDFWYRGVDEPWQFLALCKEWLGYVTYGDDHVCFVAIHVDGSCNGLQHLSAMGRDPVGARATNLTRDPVRQDIYLEVAEEVKRLVAIDAAAGIPEAVAWLGKVNRKTVKRAVMTTPYGVTYRGIRDQLVQDGHTDEIEGQAFRQADYLRDKLVDALGKTVRSARDIMAWIQGIALALADHDIPFRWTTPVGMVVQQSYWKMGSKRIKTLWGDQYINPIEYYEDSTLGLNSRKQSLASAPNVIHSFDAAHLVNTVIMSRLEGIEDFSFIHDSYGTHPCDVDTLSRILREQFVLQYSEDWLAKLEEEVRSYAPDVELPERPPLGNFDVTEVLESVYFFS